MTTQDSSRCSVEPLRQAMCVTDGNQRRGLSSPFGAQKMMSESHMSDVELLGLELHSWALVLLKYDCFCALGLSLLFS